MPAFVLDASIAVSWCFPGDPTEDNPYSRRILALLASRTSPSARVLIRNHVGNAAIVRSLLRRGGSSAPTSTAGIIVRRNVR